MSAPPTRITRLTRSSPQRAPRRPINWFLHPVLLSVLQPKKILGQISQHDPPVAKRQGSCYRTVGEGDHWGVMGTGASGAFLL